MGQRNLEGSQRVLGYGLAVSVPASMNGYGQMHGPRYREIMALTSAMAADLEAHHVSGVIYHARAGTAAFEATWTTWTARELAKAYLKLTESGCSLTAFYKGS